jgi:ankyrin repeat protein
MKGKSLLYSFFIGTFLFIGCAIPQEKTKVIKPFQYSALHSAVRLNQITNVKNILKKDKSAINLSDNFGDTPLIDAVRYNYTQIAEILICNGANINVSDTYNLRPIDNAIKNNNQKIVTMLTDKSLSFCKNGFSSTINKPLPPIKNKVIPKKETIQIEIPKEEVKEKQIVPKKNNKELEKMIVEELLKSTKSEESQIQNMVFEPETMIPPTNTIIETKEEQPQDSNLDKFELSDEELEKYINDTKTLGNL